MLSSSSTSLRSCSFWIWAPFAAASSRVSACTWPCSAATCDLAWNVLENQLVTERTGERILLAPCSIGEKTSTTPRWTLCRGLLGVSPK